MDGHPGIVAVRGKQIPPLRYGMEMLERRCGMEMLKGTDGNAKLLIHAADEAFEVGGLGQGEDGGVVGRGGTGFE